MKLATVSTKGRERVVAVVGDGRFAVDLESAAQRNGFAVASFGSMLAMIDSGQAALDRARELVAKSHGDRELMVELATVEFLAPVPVPRQIRDAMTFPMHIVQAMRGRRALNARQEGNFGEGDRIELEPLPELPSIYKEQPVFYITNRFSVRGHGHVVRWPRISKVMDYELELAIVTGKAGANIAASNARSFIFGYTIFNDFSARDIQGTEMQGRLGPAKGKSFDGGNILGPWIVTSDELPDPYNLRMTARVNGKTRCDATSSGMLFSFEELIAHISRDETIMPGEVIGSGTVGGGCELERGCCLDDGDRIDLEIENIGMLSNTVRSYA
jgi:2-keto-4-pentenoate hydratase/2-oxohepta-3-ene-1,7-dioic acid hydratase in catechol pathway